MFDPSLKGEVYRGNAYKILGSIKKSYAWVGG
jgi:hypothetical protein